MSDETPFGPARCFFFFVLFFYSYNFFNIWIDFEDKNTEEHKAAVTVLDLKSGKSLQLGKQGCSPLSI